MATQALTNVQMWVADSELASDFNALALTSSAEELDDTVFGDSTRSAAGGMKAVAWQYEGLFNTGAAGGIDSASFSRVNNRLSNNAVTTIMPNAATEGNPNYIHRTEWAEYEWGGRLGEMAKFSIAGSSTTDLVRATLMDSTTETATGSGTKRQLGAATSSQTIYVATHVIAASGTSPTLDIVIRSDTDSSAGGETTRITLSQFTGKGSDFSTLVGPVTDTWWDVSWTIGGTSPSFTFVCSIGIL